MNEINHAVVKSLQSQIETAINNYNENDNPETSLLYIAGLLKAMDEMGTLKLVDINYLKCYYSYLVERELDNKIEEKLRKSMLNYIREDNMNDDAEKLMILLKDCELNCRTSVCPQCKYYLCCPINYSSLGEPGMWEFFEEKRYANDYQ